MDNPALDLQKDHSHSKVNELEVQENRVAQSDSVASTEPTLSLKFPKILLLSRAVLSNKVAVYVVYLIPLSFVVGHSASAILRADTSSELGKIYDAFGVICVLLLFTFAQALLRAVCVGGGLEKLGLDGLTQINTASRNTLARWKLALTVIGAFFMLMGLVSFKSVTMVGHRSKISGRVITPEYAYLSVLPLGLVSFFAACIVLPWVFALQHGSVLVSEKVTKITETIKYLKPSDLAWQKQVVEGVRMLVNETLPDLSKAFGDALGNLTISLWVVSLGFFTNYLEARKPLALIVVFVNAFLPFAIAKTVSDTSDRCDTLRGAINQKRIADLGLHIELSALETCMDNENRGQGLGCAID
eukprot:SAG11_NODE_38_length_21705_cov_24.667453_16_plen_358_part_00